MSMIRLLTLTAAATLVAPSAFAGAKAPDVTAATVELAEGAPVALTVKMDELAICDGTPCYLWLGSSFKDDDKLSLLLIDHTGAWTLQGPNEFYTADYKDKWDRVFECPGHTEETKTKAEQDAKDKKAGKEPEAEAEEVPQAERESSDTNEVAGVHASAARSEAGEEADAPAAAETPKMADDDDEEATPDESWRDEPILSVEERRARVFRGSVSKQFCVDSAQGELSGDGNERTLEIAGDKLPEKSFVIYANGYFGAYAGDTQIGSPTKFGGIKYSR